MTLLSIREQEAVKASRENVEAWGGMAWSPAELRQRLLAHEQALILATRDAIARQVREQKTIDFAPDYKANAQAVVEWAATFIEGLDV